MDLYQIIITYNKAWTTREIICFSMGLCIAIIIGTHLLRLKKIEFSQFIASLLALAFLGVVFGTTVFTRNPGTRQYQLEVFWSWKEIFGIGVRGRVGAEMPEELLKENFLNMLLLLPLGILLPFIRGKKFALWKGLTVGIIVSAAIELLQLILCRGLFEFDDMIHNGIGCMVGCMIGNIFFCCIFSRNHL